MAPAALIVAGGEPDPGEGIDHPVPVLWSRHPAALLADWAADYLQDEPGALARRSAELRLACAEMALADPDPGSAAGLIAARVRRGVAVAIDGSLRTLHARPAGRAMAARFAALHARLLASADAARGASTRRHEGLWLMERRVRPGAVVWFFDDLPFAAVDEVAADALMLTMRALLRRGPSVAQGRESPSRETPAPPPRETPPTRPAPDADDPLAATLLAVARANGRVATAARALGVHRNTVLYRLRQASATWGIDPRRPEDALRILAEAERARSRPG
jgi:hypothetical protein